MLDSQIDFLRFRFINLKDSVSKTCEKTKDRNMTDFQTGRKHVNAVS